MGQSQPALKVPKWPFWTAHGALFSYGCYVALYSERPLDGASIFGPLLSVFFGCSLLAVPYVLEAVDKVNRLRTANAQASQTLSFIVNRLEQAIERLDAIEAESGNAIQSAQQVRQLIDEKLVVLRDTLAERESTETASLREEVELLRSEAGSLREISSDQINSISRGLSQLPANIDEILPLLKALDKHQQDLTLRQTGLAGSIHTLEEKLDALGSNKASESGVHTEISALRELVKKLIDRLDTPSTDTKTEPAPTTSSESLIESQSAHDDTTPSTDSSSNEEKVDTTASQEPVLTESALQSSASSVAQPTLFSDPDPAPSTTSTLQVEALIGVTNQLYIRGDAPGLSWDKGQPLEITGIGRWQWKCDGLSEPVKIHIYRNDKDPADGGPVLLKPGKTQVVRPVFSKDSPRPQW